MFKNVGTGIAILSTLSFIVGVIYPVVRSDSPTRKIPWWWWIGNGAVIVLIATITSVGWLNGVLLVLGGLSGGTGLTLLFIGVREGRIRLRPRQRWSEWDEIASSDWHKGAELVKVLEVAPSFAALSETSPHMDIRVKLLNQNVHRAWIQLDVKGRIEIPDAANTYQQITHGCDIHKIERDGVVRDPPAQGIGLQRNTTVDLILRQHLLPDVRDLLMSRAGNHVSFKMDGLHVGVIFRWRTEDGEVEEREPERIRLETYNIKIPDFR